MIRTFAHNGLRRFFDSASMAGIRPEHAKRLRLVLGVLNSAVQRKDVALPGLGLHQLTGKLKGFWAVSVSANWRVIFRFSGRNVFDVDYVDYH